MKKIVVFLILLLLVLFAATANGEEVDYIEPFDHAVCQYPARTTNPVDGCDNSDPCDALNTKGGSGECSEPAPDETLEPVITEPVIETGK